MVVSGGLGGRDDGVYTCSGELAEKSDHHPALILQSSSSPTAFSPTPTPPAQSLALAIDSISDVNNPGKMMPRPWHGSGVHVPDAGCVLLHCDRWPSGGGQASHGPSKLPTSVRRPSANAIPGCPAIKEMTGPVVMPPRILHNIDHRQFGGDLPDWAGCARLRGQGLVEFDGLVSWCNVECDLPRHLEADSHG